MKQAQQNALKELSVRAYNCLNNENYADKEKALSKIAADGFLFYRLPRNCGIKTANEIAAWLGLPKVYVKSVFHYCPTCRSRLAKPIKRTQFIKGKLALSEHGPIPFYVGQTPFCVWK